MDNTSFILTIFFLLLGPIKLIFPFAAATQKCDRRFKRQVALQAALIATLIVVLIALLGGSLLLRYRITYDSLQLAGGFVLLLSALNSIFAKPQPRETPTNQPTVRQLAISMATPVIVTPVGVAAILIFMMVSPEYPGIGVVVYQSLLIIMVLDYLVMFFIDNITKVPGLTSFLQVVGSVLVFVQVALGVETMIGALQGLKLIPG